jgi:uncharacterized protein YjiS (DUF1127 family)
MAHVSERIDAGFGHKIAASVQSFFVSLFTALAVNRDHEARFRQVQKLQAMSDADLAARGLTRDEIVRHVFRDLYYV